MNNSNNNDYDDFMSDIMQSTQNSKKGVKHGRNSWYKKLSSSDLKSDKSKENNLYLDEAFGKTRQSRVKKNAQKNNNRKSTNQKTIVIQLNGLDSARRWVRSVLYHLRKRRLLVLVAVLVLSAGFFVTPRLKDDKQVLDAQTENIAPAEVYVPKNFPEGFSAASDTEKFENGAVLYSVYNENGYVITVVQQSKPLDFDDNIFAGAQAFDTRLGKAYIIESTDRITGYLLSEDSLILFNSTDPISSSEIKILMQSFQP